MIVIYFMVSVVLVGSVLIYTSEEENEADGKSCNSSHPGGKGYESTGKKSTLNIFGKKQNSLEEAVNFFLSNALKANAIDLNC